MRNATRNDVARSAIPRRRDPGQHRAAWFLDDRDASNIGNVERCPHHFRTGRGCFFQPGVDVVHTGRIYVAEPTGSFMDDPNLTDKKFPGNPTKSYRSREPLRVVGEYLDWQGHSPEEIQAMKDAIAGLEPIDG